MDKKVFNLFFIIATSFSIQTSTFFLLRERERERERERREKKYIKIIIECAIVLYQTF
jgi:hypothetical protein